MLTIHASLSKDDMTVQLTNPITSFGIAWMDTEFGWIQLKNGAKDAGYVYFLKDSDALEIPHLSSGKDYIIMSIHISHLGDLLSILRNERPLQIRFYDPESPGVSPSAFIEALGSFHRADAEHPKLRR
jgi:hypothetical protein